MSRAADGPGRPNRITEDIKKQAIGVRAALEQSGLDHGPISVHEKMRDLGMTPVPSTAALARIFRDANAIQTLIRDPPGLWQRITVRKLGLTTICDEHPLARIGS